MTQEGARSRCKRQWDAMKRMIHSTVAIFSIVHRGWHMARWATWCSVARRWFWVVWLLGLPACMTPTTLPAPSSPTLIEQLLMTQAIAASVDHEDSTPVPLPAGATVVLEPIGLRDNQQFFKGAIAQWLGEHDIRVQPTAETAQYRVQIVIQSLGTQQAQAFFGMPPVQSVLIPFALPELTLFKAQYQSGFTRFSLNVFETTTGRYIRSSPWYQATTYYNEYTILFIINFHTTNLIGAP